MQFLISWAVSSLKGRHHCHPFQSWHLHNCQPRQADTDASCNPALGPTESFAVLIQNAWASPCGVDQPLWRHFCQVSMLIHAHVPSTMPLGRVQGSEDRFPLCCPYAGKHSAIWTSRVRRSDVFKLWHGPNYAENVTLLFRRSSLFLLCACTPVDLRISDQHAFSSGCCVFVAGGHWSSPSW